jgi:APA family basic amino acid/polyamine antiporter
MTDLLRTKDIDQLIAHSDHPDRRLKKSLGPWSLLALGVGAVIGSGIFVLTGTAAAGEKLTHDSILHAPVMDLLIHGSGAVSTFGRPGAGPAISISFLLVALACGFAALCYAELASMIPISGSAYTYAYATLGEIFAWIIGWDLILEYAVGNMAVAVGFSAYFNSILDAVFGVQMPRAFSEPMFASGVATGSYFNFPAFLIIMLLTVLLVRGIEESAGANNVMVVVKLAAIVIFVIGAAPAINPANYQPFAPAGIPGIMTGAAIVFFSYIGFDSVSTAAEECGNPQRDLPFGIIGSLIACTILYVIVALVLTGIVNYSTLNNAAPVANALKAIGYDHLRRAVSVGAIAGMVSVLLVFQYGQARIWFAMSRDRLLPKAFSHVHPKFKTPSTGTWIAGVLVAVPAGIFDIGTLADLTNIGTLFAFALVSWGVIRLRKTQPDRKRSFRVPLVPFAPLISIALCLVLMMSLPLETWIRFFVWLAIGLAIYFGYGRKRAGEAYAEQR